MGIISNIRQSEQTQFNKALIEEMKYFKILDAEQKVCRYVEKLVFCGYDLQPYLFGRQKPLLTSEYKRVLIEYLKQ